MDAKEAKQVADEVNAVKNSIVIAGVNAKIQAAAKEGGYEVSLTDKEYTATREFYEALGFRVYDAGDMRDGNLFRISWK